MYVTPDFNVYFFQLLRTSSIGAVENNHKTNHFGRQIWGSISLRIIVHILLTIHTRTVKNGLHARVITYIFDSSCVYISETNRKTCTVWTKMACFIIFLNNAFVSMFFFCYSSIQNIHMKLDCFNWRGREREHIKICARIFQSSTWKRYWL